MKENAEIDFFKQRRYDVDALRVIALSLLIFFHIFICYQPFSERIQFIRFQESLENYWFAGEILSIWRLPILFMISGMCLRFSMQRRSLNETIEERIYRLVLPLSFGYVTSVPIYITIFQLYKEMPLEFMTGTGHLWFVLYIFIYVFFFFPFFVWFKNSPNNKIILILKKCLKQPWVLYLCIFPLWISTILVECDPVKFSAFALVEYHRFWYGGICFLMGFIFISLGEDFWRALKKICNFALILAFGCCIYRMIDGGSRSNFMNVLESLMWILGVLGLGSKFLNKPSKLMLYLSKAVFPVYIMHMPVQQIIAYYLFPFELNVWVTLLLHLVFTYTICLVIYEFVLCNLKFSKPLMGMSVEKGQYVLYQKFLVLLTYPLAVYFLGMYLMKHVFVGMELSLGLTSRDLGFLVFGILVFCLILVLSIKKLSLQLFSQRWIHVLGLPIILCSFYLMTKE